MTPSPLLYKPTGAALEYCPSGTLALNPYEGNCPHACSYCYANDMNKRFGRDYPMRGGGAVGRSRQGGLALADCLDDGKRQGDG